MARAGAVGKWFVGAICLCSSIQRQFNSSHDPVRIAQDLDDFLIVANIIPAQRAALAVLQPLLRGLIAADVEIPRCFADPGEILIGVDPDAADKPLPGGEGLGWGLGASGTAAWRWRGTRPIRSPIRRAPSVTRFAVATSPFRGGFLKPRLLHHAVGSYPFTNRLQPLSPVAIKIPGG